MFYGGINLGDVTPLYNWSLSSIQDTSYMFYNCYKMRGNLIIRTIYPTYNNMFTNAGRDTTTYINVDYQIHPGGIYTSEQIRDFIWDKIVGRPYRFNEHVSLGMAVYH
jgi:hypothetical protein